MSMKELTETITGISDAFDVFTKKAEAKQAELQSRLEEIESKGSGPGKTVSDRDSAEHVKCFVNWLRKPFDSGTKQQLENCQAHIERKAGQTQVITSTPAAGGYAVPEEILRDIERHELKISPVRNIVRVVQTGTSDFKALLNERGATASWTSESGTRSQTLTPKLREVVPTGVEEYAVCVASNWSLDDVFFNVQQWLSTEVAEQFSRLESDAFVRGDGSNKWTGLLHVSPSSRDDFDSPIRTAGALQFVTDGDSPFALGYDVLVNAIYTLNSAYRAGASWIMNSATAKNLMQLKDQQLRPLWVDSLAQGQPARLLGFPVYFIEDLDDLDVTGGSNSTYPLGFGQWDRAYIVADRIGMRVIVDNVTTFGQTRFYFSRRSSGIVYNDNAAKLIKTAA